MYRTNEEVKVNEHENSSRCNGWRPRTERNCGGCFIGTREFEDIHILLYGHEEKVKPYLKHMLD